MAILILKRSAAASSPITASLVASRTSGPAPLAVFFDATGTTHTDGSINTFRSVGYAFDFGDTGAGTWAVDGESKNTAHGAPLAAHLFETPGTYTVKVKARDASGNVNQTSVTITVTDPDTVYSGTNTVFISTNADTTGSPAGAQQLLSQSSWPAWASNKRYILHAGQDFTSFGTITVNQRNDYQIIGASGTKPLVGTVEIETIQNANFSARGVFANLNMGANAWRSYYTHHHMLMLRIDASANLGAVGFEMTGAITNSIQSYTVWGSYNAFIECTAITRDYGLTAWGRSTILQGCTIGSGTDFHDVRMWQGHKVLAEHNDFGTLDETTYHQFKLHSEGLDAWNDSLVTSVEPISSYCVIRKNKCTGGTGGTLNNWAIACRPQNTSFAEGLEYIIVEDNTFLSNFTQDVTLGGRYMTARGNINSGGLSEEGTTDVPSGYNGPYYLGGASITTEAPT